MLPPAGDTVGGGHEMSTCFSSSTPRRGRYAEVGVCWRQSPAKVPLKNNRLRGEAFLEPYMQGGLAPRESPLLRLDGDTDEEDDGEVEDETPIPAPRRAVGTTNISTSPPPTHLRPRVSAPSMLLEHEPTSALLNAKFRLVELRPAPDTVDVVPQGRQAPAPCGTGGTTSEDDAAEDGSGSEAGAEAEDEGEEEEEESAGAGSCSSGGGGSLAPCDIGLLERLIRSHPVWFLAGLQRAGAVHLLQGKEEGNFVVRQSSQAATMAISVRLPVGKGPYIEHYLVQATSSGQLALESSENKFDDIPTLIAHYAQCCDELPVQLTLPRAIREARNRQQLSSLALLGQEFWRYPMANPKPERGTPVADIPAVAPLVAPPSLRPSPPPGGQVTQGSPAVAGAGSEEDERLLAHQQQRTPNSSHSSLSSFGSGSCSHNNTLNNLLNNNHSNNNNSAPSSPPKDNIVLNLAPISPGGSAEHSPPTTTEIPPRAARPNTLNLLQASPLSPLSPLSPNSAIVKTNPPKPPPRWAKPSQNFTVTTTVTFNVNQTPTTTSPVLTSPQVENVHQKPIDSPSMDPTTPLKPHGSSIVSPTENSKPILTPTAVLQRRSKRKSKESHHYQESDILESPTVYYRSSVADKISDYEDIWGPSPAHHDNKQVTSPQCPPPVTPELLTFKPRVSQGSTADSPMLGDDRRPDLLGSCASLQGRNLPVTSPVTSPVSPLQLESPASSPQEEEKVHKPAGSPFYAEPADAIRLAAVQRRRPRPTGGILPSPGQQPSQQHQRQRVLNSHRHSDPTIQHTWWPPPGTRGPLLERIDSSDELHAAASVDNIAMLRSPTSNASTPLSAVSHQHPLMASSPCTSPLAPNINPRLVGGVSESHLAIKRQQPKGKPVQPPRVLGKAKGIPAKLGDGSWAVDSSWEFFGSQTGSPAGDSNSDEPVSNRFPSLPSEEDYEEDDTLAHLDGDGRLSRRRQRKRPLTAQELIAEKCPELGIPPDCSLPGVLSPGINDYPHPGSAGTLTSPGEPACRISSYDNVEGLLGIGSSSQASDEDTHTVFSEPWDSSRWETLLMQKGSNDNSDTSSLVRLSGEPPLLADEEDETMLQERNNSPQQPQQQPQLARTKSFRDRMDPLLSPPRLQALRCREGGSTGASIRAYALQLAADRTTTFAQNIENFISCTRESKERSPHVAMRNMRQFMSGMKNYLVKHGERGFEKEVEKERLKLKATEFLNLDAILEGVMHKLVVRPLREHLYRLFVAEYSRTGAIQLLASNIQYARTKPAQELGIRSKICPPSERSLHTICHYLTRLQQVDSPLEKLENLLACISSIFNSVKSSNQGRGGVMLGADDFLPLFVWVLVRGGMVAAEIEAEFMWGLLQPSLLSGEGGYYLTTLSSAVHVLKNFRACSEMQNPPLDWRGGSLGSLAELRSVLRIVVPDELHGSILTKTLPVRPNTTTRDVCKIIAHKIRITNPQDYGLYKLVDGEETLLNEGECPQDVKDEVCKSGKHCVFAYKRIDAKIAWPRTSPSPVS